MTVIEAKTVMLTCQRLSRNVRHDVTIMLFGMPGASSYIMTEVGIKFALVWLQGR